jgi:hypothetical protein
VKNQVVESSDGLDQWTPLSLVPCPSSLSLPPSLYIYIAYMKMPSDEPKLLNDDDGDNDVSVISTKNLRSQSEDIKCFPLFNENKYLAYGRRSHQLTYQSSTNPS